ncbi:MAG: hypothetical protein JSU63_18775 [Phycisphaerales bacterium]|nr:MAG: hypothetical protein JSU63_18775 [Phycisphaerales bacterium]
MAQLGDIHMAVNRSPNSTGCLLEWELRRSGIKGEVASAFDIALGDDPEKGRVLPVHYPLSYEKLKEYEFDPNAEMYYAMEIAADLENGGYVIYHSKPATDYHLEPASTLVAGGLHFLSQAPSSTGCRALGTRNGAVWGGTLISIITSRFSSDR